MLSLLSERVRAYAFLRRVRRTVGYLSLGPSPRPGGSWKDDFYHSLSLSEQRFGGWTEDRTQDVHAPPKLLDVVGLIVIAILAALQVLVVGAIGYLAIWGLIRFFS